MAHQRRIRDRLTRTEPRSVAPSLRGYSVEMIAREAALLLVLKYEWLGNIGRSTLFAGLVSPTGELQGAVCFGHGPAGRIRDVIGGPALCLERGVCAHYAPKNAASFLISRAIRLVHRLTGVERFFAYADPQAGEYGAVYQAAGWAYLGQGLNGKQGTRRRRLYVLPPGCDPGKPDHWRIDRDLRRNPRRLSFVEARGLGWRIMSRAAKHVYAVNVGGDRRTWLERLATVPYPKPRPELTRHLIT